MLAICFVENSGQFFLLFSMGSKLIFTENTPYEQYLKLYALQVGDVFKIQSDYETVMQRIEDYKPTNIVFEVFPINPGTSLFTIYGPDHCVVTNNHLLLD